MRLGLLKWRYRAWSVVAQATLRLFSLRLWAGNKAISSGEAYTNALEKEAARLQALLGAEAAGR